MVYIYVKISRFEKAEEAYIEALKIYRALPSENIQDYGIPYATLLAFKGNKESLEEAQEILQALEGDIKAELLNAVNDALQVLQQKK